MNKKFTKLMAALALLVFMMPSLAGWGQASVGTTMWAETWTGATTATGGNNNATPSANYGHGTTVYNNGTVTYTQSANTVYVRNENLAGGDAPELMLSSGKTWTISDIPTGQASELTLTYKSNNTKSSVTCSTSGATITGSSTSYTITTGGAETLTLVFGCSGNTRIDDVSLTVKTAAGGGSTTYTVTFNAGTGTFVGNSDFPNASNNVAAGTYTLPSATPATGYTFDGWVATGIATPITGSYTVSGAVAFTAHYTQSGSSGQIATLTATNLDLETSYPSSEQTVTIDGITYAYHYLMKSSTNIQAQATNGVIRNTTAYSEDIVSVAITHSSTARATTIWGSANGENWTSVATGSGSITADFSGKGYKYFKITRGSNAAYWTQIVITCEAASSVAKPTFNPAGGIYTSAQSVTISAESGADIYYTTDGSQPSTNSTSYTGAINIASTTTLKAIAVVNGESSNVASATYTIITPLTSMQAIFDNAIATPASHEVAITFNGWVISGQNGSQSTGSGANRAWLTDNNGKGCVIYDSNNPGLMANNVLNGTVICNLQLNNGSAQITGVNSSTKDINGNSIVSTGGTIIPFETSIGNLSGVNTGAVVKLNHLRCTSSGTGTTSNVLTDGTNSVYANNNYSSSAFSYEVGKIYDLTGVYSHSTSSKTIYPRSASDVVEAPKATLAMGTLSHVAEYFVFDENYSVTIENNSAQVYVGTEVSISIEMEENYFVESLTVTDGNNQSVDVTELTPGVYYSFTMPASGATVAITAREAAKYALTIGEHNHVGFTITDEERVEISDLTQIYEGATVNVETSVESGYYLQSLNVTYGENQTVEVTTNAPNHYSFTMPSGDAVLSATVRDAITYTLVTSIDELMPGKHYIIVGKNGGDAYAMGKSRTNNNRLGVSVTIGNDGKITEAEGLYEFTISGSVSDFWTIYDKNEKNENEGTTLVGYLYASGATSSNSMQLQASNDNRGQWTITIDENHLATIAANITTTNARKYLRYNHNSGNPDLFSCYNTSTANVYLYVKDGDTDLELYSPTTLSSTNTITVPANGILTVQTNGSLVNTDPANLIIEDGGQLITSSTGVQATVQKSISKATHWGAQPENPEEHYSPDGWYFIASPVNGAAFPTGSVNDQDIYQLDWANNNWLNLQNSSHSSLLTTGFQRGTGYLYASKDGNTISVAGEIQPLSNDDNATVTLANDGWNLIGNPLTCKVTVEDHSFGLLNNGSAIDYTGTTVNPFQGIVVWGNAYDVVTFTKAATQNAAAPGNSSLQMTVAQNVVTRGNTTSTTVDNAVVSFNESSILPKFNMLEGNAKLYIPQGTEEYAIVNAEAQGEMPVSFRANENGQYTLTVNPENVEMGYLHLIDNMTGADIDLLANPSYTFNAKTTDYESRFRLVFAANNNNNEDGPSTGSTTFAFFSNGSWIINNEGEATLQVIDLNGRILSSETINGSVSKSINATTGIYMMRLINGDNVKTQKVVVR